MAIETKHKYLLKGVFDWSYPKIKYIGDLGAKM